MILIVASYLLFSNIYGLDPNKTYDKISIAENDQILDSVNVFILYLKTKKIQNLKIINSEIVGLKAEAVKFNGLNIENTVLKGASLQGAYFSNCSLNTVIFLDSDLSFTNINTCNLKNVIFKNTIKYELSNF